MTVSNKKLAKILKLAAKSVEAAKKKCSDAEAKNTTLADKVQESEKMARARAIATKLVVGDDVRKEIDERTAKLASEDMDVIEKALELGKQEAVLKLGHAYENAQNNGNNEAKDTNALVDFLVTLL